VKSSFSNLAGAGVFGVVLTASALAAGQTAPTPPIAPAAPTTQAAPRARAYATTVHTGGRPYLGVNIEDVSSDRVSALKLSKEQGVEITLVDNDAPAGKAGLREHDVILSYNGTPVESEEQFRRLIRETPAGRKITLGISRDGQQMNVPVTLAAMPRNEFARTINIPPINIPPIHVEVPEVDVPDFQFIMRNAMPRVGIVAESLTPQLADYFGAKDGVLVRSVEKGSAADSAGVRAGDVIVKVGDEKITDRTDLSRAFRQKAGSSIAVVVLREKREQTLTVKVPERRERGANENYVLELPDVDRLADMTELVAEQQLIAQHFNQQFSKNLEKSVEQTRKQMEKLRLQFEEQ